MSERGRERKRSTFISLQQQQEPLCFFTQPNSAAVKLLDKRKGSGVPQTRSGSSSGSRLCPPVPSAPAALSHPNRPAPAPADVSPPIFLGSGNLAVVPRVGESRSEGNNSALPQVSTVLKEGGTDLLGSPVHLFWLSGVECSAVGTE